MRGSVLHGGGIQGGTGIPDPEFSGEDMPGKSLYGRSRTLDGKTTLAY